MWVGIAFAFILIVVIPVGFLMSTSIAAAVMGELLRHDAEKRNDDSELLDTNY
ncbi:MAG: hypothetical protein AAGD35_04875 [Actinomycetota bacterium]